MPLRSIGGIAALGKIAAIVLLGACAKTDGFGNNSANHNTTTITLTGKVYDAAVDGAAIGIFAGTNPFPIANTTSDAQGNYSVQVNLDANSLDSACVVLATKGNIRLSGLAGSFNSIRTAIASGQTLSDLNVTNVSTAKLAMLRKINNGQLPPDAATREQLMQQIKGDFVLQNQLLETAAAIKAVIDHGAPLPTGIANTEALAIELVNASPAATEFVSSNAAAVDVAMTETSTDALLLAQLITPSLTNADIENAIFAHLTEQYLIQFAANGNASLFDRADVLNGTQKNFTWSLDATAQVLTLTAAGDTAATYSFAVLKRNENSFTGTLTQNGIDKGLATFVKTSNAAERLGMTVFSVGPDNKIYASSVRPTACTGAQSVTNYLYNTPVKITTETCDIHSPTGVFIRQGEIPGSSPAQIGTRVIVPIVGPNGFLKNLDWGYSLSATPNIIGRLRLPLHAKMPTAGVVTLRKFEDGVISLAMTDINDNTQLTVRNAASGGTAITSGPTVQTLSLDKVGPVDNPYFSMIRSVAGGGSPNFVMTLPGGVLDANTNERTVIKRAVVTSNLSALPRHRTDYAMRAALESEVIGKSFGFRIWNNDVNGTIIFNNDFSYTKSIPAQGNVAASEVAGTWAIGATSGTLEMTENNDTSYMYFGKHRPSNNIYNAGSYSSTTVIGWTLTLQ